MRSNLRRRFWVELGLSAIFAASTILTVLNPRWVEVFLGIDPDEGSGAFEMGLTMTLLMVSLAVAAIARLEFRGASFPRPRRDPSAPNR